MVDYQLLKKDCSGGVGLVVGWCPSSSFIFLLLDCCVHWDAEFVLLFLLLGLENGEGACVEQKDDPKWNVLCDL